MMKRMLVLLFLVAAAASGQTSYYPANQDTNPGVDLVT